MKPIIPRGMCRRIAVLPALLLFRCLLAHAQEETIAYNPGPDPNADLYIVLDDADDVSPIDYSTGDYSDGTDSSGANCVTATYLFSVETHSNAFVHFELTNVHRNRTAISVPWWPDDRVAGTDTPLVGAGASFSEDNGGGEIFTCAAGDTLGFERGLWWYAAPRNLEDSGTVGRHDSLDYVVELVRASDSTRLALIDSIGILPGYAPGRPGIYGLHPLHGVVRFAVPVELSGIPAFMRLRPYYRGGGNVRWWARSDRHAREGSTFLRPGSRYGRADASGLGNPFYETRLLSTLEGRAPTMPRLEAAVSTGWTRRVTVVFAPAGGTATAIGVYDVNGRALFHPFSARALSTTPSVEFDLPPEGSCYVGLLHNGRLVAARRVAVPR